MVVCHGKKLGQLATHVAERKQLAVADSRKKSTWTGGKQHFGCWDQVGKKHSQLMEMRVIGRWECAGQHGGRWEGGILTVGNCSADGMRQRSMAAEGLHPGRCAVQVVV